jgi:hypothetical protein
MNPPFKKSLTPPDASASIYFQQYKLDSLKDGQQQTTD